MKRQHKYNGRKKREKTQKQWRQSVGNAAWRVTFSWLFVFFVAISGVCFRDFVLS